MDSEQIPPPPPPANEPFSHHHQNIFRNSGFLSLLTLAVILPVLTIAVIQGNLRLGSRAAILPATPPTPPGINTPTPPRPSLAPGCQTCGTTGSAEACPRGTTCYEGFCELTINVVNNNPQCKLPTPTLSLNNSDKLDCYCNDGFTQTTCVNIVCSSSSDIDAYCIPACSKRGGLKATGCVDNHLTCSQPQKTPTPVPTTYIPTPTPAFIPVRIDSGASSNTFSGGIPWVKDTGFSGGSATSVSRTITGTSFPSIYNTYRFWSTDPAGSHYTLPIKNGNYTVNLLFSENWTGITKPGMRVFDTNVEGTVKSIDVYKMAGGLYKAIVVPFNVTVKDGVLNIRFIRKVQNPLVNGIEILAAPSPITPTPTSVPQLSTTLISPNGGETVTKGTTHAISWNEYSTPIYSTIELFTRINGVNSRFGPINNNFKSVTGKNTYYWNVPLPSSVYGNMPDGNNYLIKITSYFANSVVTSDFSNQTFNLIQTSPTPSPILSQGPFSFRLSNPYTYLRCFIGDPNCSYNGVIIGTNIQSLTFNRLGFWTNSSPSGMITYTDPNNPGTYTSSLVYWPPPVSVVPNAEAFNVAVRTKVPTTTGTFYPQFCVSGQICTNPYSTNPSCNTSGGSCITIKVVVVPNPNP